METPGQLVTGSRERIITSLLAASLLCHQRAERHAWVSPAEGKMMVATSGGYRGKHFKLLGPSIGQIFPGRFSTGYSSGSSWSGFLRVLRFPPPEKLISSSSFHCLDMTLAVAEAINPDKLNQTEDFHKTPCLEDTPCTRCVLKLNLSLQSKFCGSAG